MVKPRFKVKPWGASSLRGGDGDDKEVFHLPNPGAMSECRLGFDWS